MAKDDVRFPQMTIQSMRTMDRGSRLTSHLYAHAESSKNIDIHIAFWMIRDYRTMFKIFNQQSFRCQAKHLVFPSIKIKYLKSI